MSVVVPAYQEQDRIGGAIATIRSALAGVEGGVEVVVVDDGSSDATADEARAAGADRVIVHAANRGKGAAVRTGMLAGTGRTLAFTDADLAYAPAQLAGLLEVVESGVDVVVGSRMHEDTRTLVRAGRLREIGGRAINGLTRLVVLRDHRDTQCGLKAFGADAAKVIFDRSRINGFAFDVEVFVIAEHNGLTVREVPVTVVNTTRSSVHVWRDAARLVVDLFRIRRWSRRGFYE